MSPPHLPTRRDFLELALPTAVALSGCQDARVPPPRHFGVGRTTPRRGGTLRYSMPVDISSLDPATSWDAFQTDSVINMYFDTLLDYAPCTAANPSELVPQLAERWSCSADGLVYTFHLREDARFWNGEPVLAEDFVYSLNRLLDPDVGAAAATLYKGIAGALDRLAGKSKQVAGISAPNKATLQIRLEVPDLTFPHLMTMRNTTPLKKSHVEKVGARMRDLPLGTGPFMLGEWREGQRIVHERNPHYWNKDRPLLDRVVIDFNVPGENAMLRFLRGEYDFIHQPSPDDYLRIAASPAWAPYINKSLATITDSFHMHTQKKPFSDKRVRQAINYAIDKEAFVRIMNGREVIANGYTPPAVAGHNPRRKPYPYDPEKARSLLREAGYSDGLDIVFTTTKFAAADPVGESMQSDLAAVGIRVKLQYLSSAMVLQGSLSGDITFALSVWWMDYPDIKDFLEPTFHGRNSAPGGTNGCHYSNPEFDRLVDRASIEIDPEKRIALFQQAEDILFDDCPCVFLGFPIIVDVLQPYLKGYIYHPCRWRGFRDAWLDEGPKETT